MADQQSMTDRRNTWPLTDDARLTELWAAGHSTITIGDMMGRTKNAVVGRARRLKLPARPSPIVREYTRKAGKVVREYARKGSPAPQRPSMRSAEALARTVRAEKPVFAAPPPIVPRVVVSERERGGCKWPMWGSTERATHVYCDAPRDGCGPYCAAHHAQAISHRERAA